ncbi:MAG: aldo/keto reductase [Armatimonadetes bacterium]|nr:aldo/keto reductase [Armatimonadota bacterium]
MEYRNLGRTGVQVSNPCLGTMTFGWDPDDWGSTQEESFAIADAAVELGINFLDTANVYGRGESERILGEWMKDRNNRDSLVIATKCHGKMDDNDPNMRGNTRRNIIASCEASLTRLQTDYIDLYQIHRPQPSVPIDETIRAMEDLIRQGKILYTGCSTYAAWQVTEAHYVAKMLGARGFMSEQPPYNLLDRRIECELLPFCRTYDYAVIPWSPLAGGQLSGKYLQGTPDSGRYAKSDPMNRVNEETTKVVKALDKLAKKYGMSLTQLSLAWVANQPGITVPIIGARSEEQLKWSVEACNTALPEGITEEIDEIVPPASHFLDYYKADFGPNARPNV